MLDITSYRIRIGCFQQKITGAGSVIRNRNKKCSYPRNKRRTLLFFSIATCILYTTLNPNAPLQAFYSHTVRGMTCQPTTTNTQTVLVDCLRLVQVKPQPLPLPARKSSILENVNFLARYKYGNKREHGIKIVHWNKGPSLLENKRNDIEALVQKHRPHILGLSEANLFRNHDLSNVQLPEYTLHTCPTLDNPGLNVSRVVVYTHNSLVVKLRPDLMNDNVSTIWLEVGLPRRRKILVCNLYREWGYLRQPDRSSHTVPAQLERWSTFIEQWELAIGEDREILVTGDVNLNSLKWMRDDLPATDSTNKLRSLIDLLFARIIPHGFSQCVTVATHSWPGQVDSCLDHLYTNRVDKLSDITVHVNGGSDHRVVCVTRYTKSLKKNVRYIRKRCFKNFNELGFKLEVAAMNWFDVYSATDVNTAVKVLTDKITRALDKYAPVRTIQVRSRYAPWISDLTKRVMVERDLAQQVAVASQDPNKWREFKNLRNNATKCLRRDRDLWERNQLDNLQNSPTDLWRNLKGWMGWKNSGPPTQLFYKGELVSSPQGLADSMNSYFIDKVTGLQSNLPPNQNDPLETLRKMMAPRSCTFHLKPVHPDEVLKIINAMKMSKATGLDNIDAWTLKLIINDVLPSLTHVINLSLTTLEFPNPWKMAKVIPLLKKDDPLNPKNYRPVALLPVMSKILEHVVFKQVVEYVEGNGLLHPSHHGSRSRHSTSTAIIEMYDTWIDSIERGEMLV